MRCFGEELKRLAKQKFDRLKEFYGAGESEFRNRGWDPGESGALKRRFEKAFRGDGAFGQTLQEVFDELVGLPGEVKKHLAFSSTERLQRTSWKEASAPISFTSIPWVSDDRVLNRHRVMYHHYHQVKLGSDMYWLYLPLDFSVPHDGYLYASVSLGSNFQTDYIAYGYISNKLLTIVLRSRTDGETAESVHLFRDFDHLVRKSSGCHGIVLHEGKSFGVDGSLIFKTPFPDADFSGKQGHLQSLLLDQYWNSFQRESKPVPIGSILRIVSGNQTGADSAAREFAKEYDIPRGGWVPLGNTDEKGKSDDDEADETETADVNVRTERNVIDSDGTVVFSISASLSCSKGSMKTVEFAKKHKPRKWLHIHKRKDDPAGELARFIQKKKIRKLNVAGPRESESKEVGSFVKATLMVATRLLLTTPGR